MKGSLFPRVILNDLPVKVICLTAAVILLLFHRVTTLSERFISVPLEVSAPSGLAVASAFPRTVKITLRGAEESIFPIQSEDVAAFVTLDAHHTAGVYRAPVKVSRKGTALNVDPLEIKVEPREISFTLEPLAERRVPVVPALSGMPAYGYEVLQSALAPQNVVIRGARSRVEGAAAVSTEEIDLTGRTASFASRVRIILPNPLLRIAGDASAEFRATIQESTAERVFDAVAFVPADLSPHFSLASAPAPGSVHVRGAQLAVDGVRPDQVRLLLDCSSVRRAGQYTLHARPDTGSSVTVLDWSPREVTVDVVAPAGR